MAAQYFAGLSSQSTSNACVMDLTPPTFAGIASLTVGPQGQLLPVWLAATDTTGPIKYEIYVQAATSTGLFTLSNRVFSTENLTASVFALPNGALLTLGTTYYVGVRAVDAVGNREANVVSLNAVSTGVLAGSHINVHSSFSVTASNQLQGTLWASLEGTLKTTGLGTASYTIYDAAGTTTGITQSGIAADVNGLFIITPVNAGALIDLTHYVVKITITVDSVARVAYKAITLGE